MMEVSSITGVAAMKVVDPQTWREARQVRVRLRVVIKTYGFLTFSLRVAPCLCKLNMTHSINRYFFLPIVFPDTLAYILVLMLQSIDFWVVKNIVGRKLVKMRWWFIIDNEGNE